MEFREIDIAVISAALGSEKYQKAANRLKAQLLTLFNEDQIFILSTKNLEKYCPRISTLYKDYLNEKHVGFGYWTWKSELVYNFLSRHKFIMYLDIGCEFNSNYISRFMLKKLVHQTSQKGYLIQDTGIPELIITKNEVFNILNIQHEDRLSSQFSATWFLLERTQSLEFSRDWLNLTLEGIHLSDNSTGNSNPLEFIGHRNDQSLFSLAAKKLKMKPTNYKPLGGDGNLTAHLLGLPMPIWPTRNISDNSKIPNWYPFKIK